MAVDRGAETAGAAGLTVGVLEAVAFESAFFAAVSSSSPSMLLLFRLRRLLCLSVLPRTDAGLGVGVGRTAGVGVLGGESLGTANMTRFWVRGVPAAPGVLSADLGVGAETGAGAETGVGGAGVDCSRALPFGEGRGTTGGRWPAAAEYMRTVSDLLPVAKARALIAW